MGFGLLEYTTRAGARGFVSAIFHETNNHLLERQCLI